MLKQIVIKNFQSHKSTIIALSDGVNSIIGQSDSGKSAILRALHWCIFNKPSGSGYVSYWNLDAKGKIKEETSVKLEYSNGDWIKRIRINEFNGYQLCINEYVTKFEALRTDVPEEVQNFLQVSEVNVQKQLDAPFLLSESAGEVARFFNSIIHLDDIDKALSAADSLKRQTTAEIKALDSQIKETTENLDKYGWVENAQRSIEKIKRIEERLTLMKSEVSSMEKIQSNWAFTSSNLAKFSEIGKAEEIIREAGELSQQISDLKTKHGIMSSLFTGIIRTNRDMVKLTRVEQAELLCEKAASYWDNLGQNTTKAAKLKALLDNYHGNQASVDKIYGIDKAFSQLSVLQAMSETVKAQTDKKIGLISTIKAVKEMEESHGLVETFLDNLTSQLPDVCPLCNKPLQEDL